MDDYFSRLKQEREEKGKTLEDIFESTRISLVYLRAIEDGELKKLPKGYDRIFMKSYLLAIGTDVDTFLEEFDRLLGRREPTQVIDLENLDREEMKRSITLNQGLKHALLWTPVAIIVTFLIYIFFSFGGDDNSENYVAGEIPEIKVEDYINSIDTTQSAIDEPVAAVNKNDSLFLVLKALDKTWIRSVVDRRDTSEYILPSNMSKTLAADSLLVFLIGKGDAIEIKVNGKTFKNLTPPGQVITRLEIDKTGIRTLIHSLPARNQRNQ